ncbi:MAG: hypothetical protein ABIF77_12095 [bacterium]
MFTHSRNYLHTVCLTLLFTALAIPVSSSGADITSASYCVHTGAFEFAVELADIPSGEIMFRIGAQGVVFGGDYERFEVNFDGDSGAILADPMVETFGTSPTDRWLDGNVAAFDLIDLGGSAWRLVGTIEHGTEPFADGDEVRDTLLRISGNPDLHLGETPIGTCAGFDPEIADIDYCVDGTTFVFAVELVNLDPGTVMFRIAADHQCFISPTERFEVNFDAVTGAITAPALVTVSGTPDHDRWQDGSLSQFELISLGPVAWLVRGRIAAGAEPLTDADSVRQTALRAAGIADQYVDDVPIDECSVPNDPQTWGAVKNLYR